MQGILPRNKSNSRIGRWTSYGPYGQYSSPYVGMGNNTVSGIDPDGGWGGGGPKAGSMLSTSLNSAGGSYLGKALQSGMKTGTRLGLQAASSVSRVATSMANTLGYGNGNRKFGPGATSESGSLSDFSLAWRGGTIQEAQTQRETTSWWGLDMKSGPDFRYVEAPLNKGYYIDMRHMLVVGYDKGEVLGHGLEVTQRINFLDANARISGLHSQDYWSNALGADFKRKYGSLLNQNPALFVKYLNKYLRSNHPKYPSLIYLNKAIISVSGTPVNSNRKRYTITRR